MSSNEKKSGTGIKPTNPAGLERDYEKLIGQSPESVQDLMTVTSSQPLFTQADVDASLHTLDRLLRSFCVNNNITLGDYITRFNAYAAECGMHTDRTSWDRNNLLAALRSGGITWKRFELTLTYVLGYRVDDIEFHLTKIDEGRPIKHALTDAIVKAVSNFISMQL